MYDAIDLDRWKIKCQLRSGSSNLVPQYGNAHRIVYRRFYQQERLGLQPRAGLRGHVSLPFGSAETKGTKSCEMGIGSSGTGNGADDGYHPSFAASSDHASTSIWVLLLVSQERRGATFLSNWVSDYSRRLSAVPAVGKSDSTGSGNGKNRSAERSHLWTFEDSHRTK
ncbi:hypothetical protein L209DRAFT_744574 [Thermothelomyces heterothallicus CBS 203.75]